MSNRNKSVAVLMGGWSAEREVSESSGSMIVRTLEDSGYAVKAINVTRDIKDLIARLTPRPDVVFNALHGRWGEDGRIQSILDILGLPYTNSGVLSSALCMDKAVARDILMSNGLRCAEGFTMSVSELEHKEPMPRPYVLKPLQEGSSVGVRIINSDEDLVQWKKEWQYGASVLVEKYIPGKEIHVAVMGDKAIGAIEIKPKNGFYDYEAKYTQGKADHIMPASLPQQRYDEVLALALRAHKVLKCEGVSRVDFRYDDVSEEAGKFYVLEVNTQPGMTPLSLVPEIAAHAGISFAQLIQWMVENPKCPEV